MTVVSQRTARPRAAVLRQRARLAWRHGVSAETRNAFLLTVFALMLTLLVVIFSKQMPFTVLMVPLLLSSVFLGPRTLPWFVIMLMGCLTISVSQQDPITARIIVATCVQFMMGLIVLLSSFRRSRLGVGGARGESMFVDLRDRILTQGQIPDVPEQWQVETALASSGGTPFAGDFMVARRRRDGRFLELVLVDVSGKGAEAGTRALLLSGAFGGLLGAMPPAQFLPAANDYLMAQDWDEGFATAVHLSLDLETGAYEIRSAGHPPAVHRHAGSGRWQALTSHGPILGLMDAAEFVVARGILGVDDAVLLYTDGMVEEPHRDIDLGLDRLMGEAESLLRGTWDNAAHRLVAAVGSANDDRAVVVVHHR